MTFETKKAEHTKLPWKANRLLILAPDGSQVAHLTKWNSFGGPEPYEAEANVEFIVRACNSHEALCDAVKQLLEHMTSYNPHTTRLCAIGDAEEALRMAEEPNA